MGYSSLHIGYRCYHPSTRRVYISRHVFDENTLPYVSPNQSQTNIDVSPHLASFVESYSKLQTHDADLGEVQAAGTHINGDNTAPTPIIDDDEISVVHSNAGLDVDQQVECDAADFESARDVEE